MPLTSAPKSGPASGTTILPALLRKEWLTIRGNTNQLLGLLTPLVFVFILSRGIFATHTAYLLPAAVGYAMLGPMAAVYNIFGPEATGVQLYLLAPVSMRDVILAKNLSSLAVLGLECAAAWIIALWVSPLPIPAVAQLSALLWVVFVLALNLAVGNLRSIQAPRRFLPGQARGMRSAPTARTSGLLVLAMVIASLLLEVPVVHLSRHYDAPWLAVLIFGLLAAAGIASYMALLRNVDAIVLRNRDILEKELCGI